MEEKFTDIHQDCFLSVPDMIRANGFPCDELTVETDDGFLLGVHRLPNPDGEAVLIQHGLLADSSNFVTAGPEHGLGTYRSNHHRHFYRKKIFSNKFFTQIE